MMGSAQLTPPVLRAPPERLPSREFRLARRGPVEGVEQQLECGVRLRAELRAETEKDSASLAVAHFDGAELVLNVLRPANPAALQRIVGGIPHDGAGAVFRKGREQLERRTVQKIGRRFFGHAV